MKVSIIAAVAENRAIGKDNDLIWHLPDDMKFFKDTTLGHFVIMGRKNWESIPHRFRPLKDRPNVVVTRDESYEAEDGVVVNSIEEGLELARKQGEDEAFIIGGGAIYKLALDHGLVDIMYITHVHEEFEADVFFPDVDYSKWNKETLAHHDTDERHAHSFEIARYTRS